MAYFLQFYDFFCLYIYNYRKGMTNMKFIKRFMLNQPAEKRLVYFYSMVATDEQVWLLQDENGELYFQKVMEIIRFYYLFGQVEASCNGSRQL